MRPIDDYIATIRSKTAALFRAAGDLGAATSDAPVSASAALARYGENLGLAFQLVDDLLDLVGDPDVIGKAPGTDLRAGVFTAPVLLAAQREPLIAERLNDGMRDVRELFPALISSRALDDARAMAVSYADEARAALASLPDSRWRAALDDVVSQVLLQA